MPFNGSGVFQRVRNWVADAAAGIKIRADYHDAEDNGFAEGLSNTITRDGQSVVTQNIPWNSKRITGLADPVNDQDAATKKYADVAFKTGGKMTGDLEIEKDHPVLILDDTDASGAEIVFQHMGKTRWIVRMNADAETGTGNAGSNFDIRRYADDGTTLLGTPTLIDRASGKYTITGDLYSNRSATEGVVFLGSDSTHYLHWSGTTYNMPGGPLTLGAQGTVGGHAVTLDQLNTKQASLGFTPVQQGGAGSMTADKVYIGWQAGVGLVAQINASPLGAFVFGTGNGVTDIRLQLAGNASWTGIQTVSEPFAGAVCTGLSAAAGGGMTGRFRYLQININGTFYTVAYTT